MKTIFALTTALLVLIVCQGHAIDDPTNFRYGNWGGKNHPGDLDRREAEGRIPVPIDEIDEACKVHDFQYRDRDASGERNADRELSRKIQAILERGKCWEYSPRPSNHQTDASEFERMNGVSLSTKQKEAAAAILAAMKAKEAIWLADDLARKAEKLKRAAEDEARKAAEKAENTRRAAEAEARRVAAEADKLRKKAEEKVKNILKKNPFR